MRAIFCILRLRLLFSNSSVPGISMEAFSKLLLLLSNFLRNILPCSYAKAIAAIQQLLVALKVYMTCVRMIALFIVTVMMVTIQMPK